MRRIHRAVLFLPFFLLTAALIALPCRAGAVKETDRGVFYSQSEEGFIVIEGFNDVGSVLDIPAEIDGLPVRRVADQACRGNAAIIELRLPETLETIGESAFAECPNLLRVSMAGGTVIGFRAFSDDRALLSVTLPDTLTEIEDEAFFGCVMLGRTVIPGSVVRIGTDAFAGCSRISFDVSRNPYAAAYAKEARIPTSFTETWGFTVLLIAAVTALLGAGLLLIGYRKRKKKKTASRRV